LDIVYSIILALFTLCWFLIASKALEHHPSNPQLLLAMMEVKEDDADIAVCLAWLHPSQQSL
jgi:hypothetical protein